MPKRQLEHVFLLPPLPIGVGCGTVRVPLLGYEADGLTLKLL